MASIASAKHTQVNYIERIISVHVGQHSTVRELKTTLANQTGMVLVLCCVPSWMAGVPANAIELHGFARDVSDDGALDEATHHTSTCTLLMNIRDDVPAPSVDGWMMARVM